MKDLSFGLAPWRLGLFPKEGG